MTEAEWLASEDPQAMLQTLREGAFNPATGVRRPLPCGGISDRKLRLFACGIARIHRPKEIESIAIAESAADANQPNHNFSDWHARETARWWCLCQSTEAAQLSAEYFRSATTAALLRCIAGNPSRPAMLPKTRRVEIEADIEGGYPVGYRMECPWLTPTVLRLARHIYDFRDWAAMAGLHDALLEAGCEEDAECSKCEGFGARMESGTKRISAPDEKNWIPCIACDAKGRISNPILAHLRSGGPHARGCHVLDLLLGKE